MKYQNYTNSKGTCSGFSAAVTIAVILLFALLTANCGGQKQMHKETSHVTDSLLIRERSEITPITIPRTQADLRLKIKDVENLTPGAVFTDKNGQASVRVERRDSLIYITATCDSLQVLVESQSREIYHLREQLSQQENVREKTPGFWEQAKTAVFYIAAGMALMFIIQLKKRVL